MERGGGGGFLSLILFYHLNRLLAQLFLQNIFIESKRRYFTRNQNKNNLYFQEDMVCCELMYISNHSIKQL
jgi:hypothetical protein